MAKDQVNILSQGVADEKSKLAIRQLERLVQSALVRIQDLELSGSGGGASLPINISDVTGLATALASKAALADLVAKADKTTTINISPGTGGGDLSASRTLVVADNSTSSKGVV